MASAARIVLRDWSIGKFDRYTTPPSSAAASVKTATAQSSTTITAKPTDNPCDDDITRLYANDEAILSTIPTRKERRKRGGLVKFVCCGSGIDPRKVAVEEPWNGLEQDDDEESDGDEDEDENDDVQGMDIDGEDEDEEDEDEDEDEEMENDDEDEDY